MAVLINAKANALVGGGVPRDRACRAALAEAPARGRLVRVGPYVEGRRPARLVAAPRHARAVDCAPRSRFGSAGWLIVVGGLTFAVALALIWSAGGSASAVVPSTTAVVQIRSGETLWDVAREQAPGSVADAVVAQIMRINSLTNASVYPGELLRVPSSLRG